MATHSATNRLSGLTYDDSGNVTAWGTWTYVYDPFNMMTQANGVEGRHFDFVYGPGDERLWVIDWTNGPEVSDWVETWTLRDLDGSPLRQYRITGGNTANQHWQADPEFPKDYAWRDGSVLGSVTAEGVVRHFHLDHLGSPRMVTDSTGHTLALHLYFPFGEEATDPSQDSLKLKFTGHERDNLHSGTTYDLDYMHARYYSPQLGRFLSADPVGGSTGVPQTWNRYSYVRGNPLKYTDPAGLAEIDSCAVNQDQVSCTGEVTAGLGDGLPTSFANFLGFGAFLRNPGSLNSLPHLPGFMQGMSFNQALSTAVALGAGGDCASDPNCAMLADVSRNKAFFEGLTWIDAQIAGGYVGGEAFSLFGEALTTGSAGFRLFGTGSRVGRLGYRLGGHAIEQMEARGVTEGAVDFALRNGTRYWDGNHLAVSYVVEGGYASGKSLVVAVNPASLTVTTVIRTSRVASRLVALPP